MTQKSVIVIGAGVVGAATALALQERGHRVTLLDRGEPGQGASFGNASALAATEVVPIAAPGLLKQVPKWLLDPEGPLFLSPSYLPAILPWLLKFLRNSTKERTEIAAAALASLCQNAKADTQDWLQGLELGRDLVENHTLRLYPTRSGYENDAYRLGLRKRHVVEFDVLDQSAINRLEPCIKDTYEVGVLTHGAHYFRDPVRPIVQSVAKLEQLGGKFNRHAVARLEKSSRGTPSAVLENGDTLQADHVVLASGIWSAKLARNIGDRFPLESERGYHVQFTKADVGLNRTLVDTARGFAVTPVEGGLRVAGSVEFKGIKAAPDYNRSRILEKHAYRMFGKTLEQYQTTDWMGHRPSLPDGLPVIGASRRQPGLMYAFGHGHLGLTFAATTARLVSDQLSGQDNIDTLAPFAPGRF